jgi:hypothetical protein
MRKLESNPTEREMVVVAVQDATFVEVDDGYPGALPAEGKERSTWPGPV